MSKQLAEEGTHLRYVQDLLARAYEAISDDGSNDAEHDVLIEVIDFLEDDVRAMGGDLPANPNDDDED